VLTIIHKINHIDKTTTDIPNLPLFSIKKIEIFKLSPDSITINIYAETNDLEEFRFTNILSEKNWQKYDDLIHRSKKNDFVASFKVSKDKMPRPIKTVLEDNSDYQIEIDIFRETKQELQGHGFMPCLK
jgi:hypothetical protein